MLTNIFTVISQRMTIFFFRLTTGCSGVYAAEAPRKKKFVRAEPAYHYMKMSNNLITLKVNYLNSLSSQTLRVNCSSPSHAALSPFFSVVNTSLKGCGLVNMIVSASHGILLPFTFTDVLYLSVIVNNVFQTIDPFLIFYFFIFEK